jgi:hypothetical protein
VRKYRSGPPSAPYLHLLTAVSKILLPHHSHHPSVCLARAKKGRSWQPSGRKRSSAPALSRRSRLETRATRTRHLVARAHPPQIGDRALRRFSSALRVRLSLFCDLLSRGGYAFGAHVRALGGKEQRIGSVDRTQVGGLGDWMCEVVRIVLYIGSGPGFWKKGLYR